ncbi:MAG: PilZ domain-containing protein [Candidatus Omnitrophota bacterium]
MAECDGARSMVRDSRQELFVGCGYGLEEAYSGKDRRCYARVKDHIFIFCYPQDNLTELIEAVTRDVSAEGLSFDTDVFIHKDTEFFLEMYAPVDYHKRVLESITIKVRVAWQELLVLSQGANKWRVGLEFIAVNQEDRGKIAKYVEEGFVNRR